MNHINIKEKEVHLEKEVIMVVVIMDVIQNIAEVDSNHDIK